ncbi:hypothetical protein JOQ06_028430 [Pogonophryne albipinna]|uniref:HAT C-terminal dimerisation domain-containing protein n=1 Tax=Pogonophryne albipinna TaxID=1090488 RepID=A0AAD6FL33_9TELE|nr:hypothetical protein JOQ06_028430 [Pogonophryne albipinna]
MDILSAHRMVSATQESLKSIARDFKTVKAAADTFAKWTNENIEEREEGTDIEVAVALPQKRTKKRSRAEEMSPDDELSDAERAYEFLLTLSLTQVACERTFSTLKFIKSRLRSSLSENKLDTFLLMATEKDILMALDSDVVIDRVAEKSD